MGHFVTDRCLSLKNEEIKSKTSNSVKSLAYIMFFWASSTRRVKVLKALAILSDKTAKKSARKPEDKNT